MISTLLLTPPLLQVCVYPLAQHRAISSPWRGTEGFMDRSSKQDILYIKGDKPVS